MNDARTLGERGRGWLRFAWEKATTIDDWSSEGEPHPWWDDASSPPMCTFARFDLVEMGTALAVMAEVTPAWREVYGRMVDELVRRHTTFWAAIDWITLIGPDPRRDSYPPEWQILLPDSLRGNYEVPGWTGNGLEPWGLQPDPIGADGNLFFRAYFNLLLGIYRYITDDDKWEKPFPVTGYRERRFHWTHSRINEFLDLQFSERPQGPHCENTKIWPNCLSCGGLGMLLYDSVHGTTHNHSYQRWLQFAKEHYMGFTRGGDLAWFAMYYDPLQEEALQAQGQMASYIALETLWFLYPQERDFAQRLYELCMRSLGWSDRSKPLVRLMREPRLASRALVLAREFGDDVTEGRLRQVAESEFEPRQFGPEQQQFGYWFGLDAPWPRGQLTAAQIMADIGAGGSLWRVFNEPDRRRFTEPTVEGIDYPSLGVAQAYNDRETGVLWVKTYAATPSQRGSVTTWRVTNLPDPGAVKVTCDGQDFGRLGIVNKSTIELACEVAEHSFRIETGHAGPRPESSTALEASGTPLLAEADTALVSARLPPMPAQLPSASDRSCSCC